MITLPTLRDQEVPFDHPDSRHFFQPGPNKPFVATRAAIDAYSHEVIAACLLLLQQRADEVGGLDYLQVFEDSGRTEELWFIEEGAAGQITALLPSDR